jgi:predicted acyl esterase
MTDAGAPLFRLAVPPDDPRVEWRGFQPGRTVLPAGSTYSNNGRALPCDIVLDRDVELTLRDGTRIYADVFRPATDEPLPAILAWSPYGKQGGIWKYDTIPGRAGVAESATSGLEKFEGPDPAFWCANGYVVVNVDPRGAFASEGDVQAFSPQEAQDGYDVVEEIAAADWCSGAVTMVGNSWLAITQWKIAATRPPHLAAIAPWEGHIDVYRDQVRRGGIPNVSLAELITQTTAGRGRVEDLPAMARAYPLMNDLWRSKITDIEAIDVPVYAVASWTNWLHTRGTLAAFSRLDPSRSWLRVHNTFEWPDQYAHEADLLQFFDHVIKGADNGWQDTPRVRLSVLDPGAQDVVDRPEDGYPLARAQETALYLQADGLGISAEPVAHEGQVEYDAAQGNVVFEYEVDRDLEIVGPMKLRLWLEVEGADDADVFVYVRKADPDGRPLLSPVGPGVPSLGAHGRLRASHRELDERISTPLEPVQAHERELKLTPGEPVALEIGIWPHGMLWHPGQRLQVVVSGTDLMPAEAGPPNDPNPNTGTHRVRTGGRFDSHLLVPVVS